MADRDRDSIGQMNRLGDMGERAFGQCVFGCFPFRFEFDDKTFLSKSKGEGSHINRDAGNERGDDRDDD